MKSDTKANCKWTETQHWRKRAKAAEERNAKLERALQQLEWSQSDTEYEPGDTCPACCAREDHGHHNDCYLAQALTGLDTP